MEKVNIQLKGVIKEIGEEKIDIPTSIDVKKLIEETKDKNPLFVTAEILSPQVSRNGRMWTEEIIKSVEKQINENKPDAYQGHLKESERGTKTPDSQTIWIGAATKNIKGKMRLYAKGYVLPYAEKLKIYLKAAKATGKNIATSVYGVADQIWNESKKAYEMSNFQLETIDWARPGSEGVQGTGYFSLASEMKQGGSEEINILKKQIEENESRENKLKETIKEMTENYISIEVDNKVGKHARGIIRRIVLMEMKEKEYTKENADKIIQEIIESKDGMEIIKEVKETIIPAQEVGSDKKSKYIDE